MSMFSIVDSHVHLWNPAKLRYLWLDNLPALNHAFLPVHYSDASATANVNKIIFVESGCAPSQNLAEVDWISRLAKEEPRLKGIIAHVPLEKGETVQPDLEKLSLNPLVKGVRRNLQGESDLGFCLQPNFIIGIKLLAKFNFTCDVCIRHEQLGSIVELVHRVPHVNFILDHFGKPDVRGKRFEPWATCFKSLAGLPNVVCKISGLATEADWKNWQKNDFQVYFQYALECFGFDRILFGSDWPVAVLATSYERWLNTVQGFFSFTEASDQIKLFQTNAERSYRV